MYVPVRYIIMIISNIKKKCVNCDIKSSATNINLRIVIRVITQLQNVKNSINSV